jgi:hypothetical protein
VAIRAIRGQNVFRTSLDLFVLDLRLFFALRLNQIRRGGMRS